MNDVRFERRSIVTFYDGISFNDVNIFNLINYKPTTFSDKKYPKIKENKFTTVPC